MTTTITVYGKPACVQCRMTEAALDKVGADYQKVDLTQDLKAFLAVQELGYLRAPIVVVRVPGADSDLHWSGFRPDLINDYCTPKEPA